MLAFLYRTFYFFTFYTESHKCILCTAISLVLKVNMMLYAIFRNVDKETSFQEQLFCFFDDFYLRWPRDIPCEIPID